MSRDQIIDSISTIHQVLSLFLAAFFQEPRKTSISKEIYRTSARVSSIPSKRNKINLIVAIKTDDGGKHVHVKLAFKVKQLEKRRVPFVSTGKTLLQGNYRRNYGRTMRKRIFS